MRTRAVDASSTDSAKPMGSAKRAGGNGTRLNTAETFHRLRAMDNNSPEYRDLVGQIWQDNLGLMYQAARIINADLRDDDNQSCASFALYRAIVCFDPNRGYQFSTYAVVSVRTALLQRRRKDGRACKALPEGALRSMAVDGGHVDEVDDRLDDVNACIQELTDRERLILFRRYHLQETLNIVGREEGYSRERIRQIQREAVIRIRRHLVTLGHKVPEILAPIRQTR